MTENNPGFFEMIRINGLIAMLFPLVISTAVAMSITGNLNISGLFFAAVVGFSIHISMNVYNDIYDTKQGSDSLSSSKNLFSGGSATIIKNPELEGKMFTIARAGLFTGLLGTLGLMWTSEIHLWPVFIFIFLTASFLSKYYTAEPFKFAYRGLGEIVVWFGFGPLAILLGSTAQGVPFHPLIISIMPITGLTTLIFSWSGELADMPYDIKANKRGLVLRLGIKKSMFGLLILHFLLISNIIFVAYLLPAGWILILAMIPYLLLMAKTLPIFKEIIKHTGESKVRHRILELARLNFFSFIIFSALVTIGFVLLVNV